MPTPVPGSPEVEIVVPVYNEQADLEPTIRRLDEYCATLPWTSRITIADNASTDQTWAIAQRLRASLPRVAAVHLDAKGRGRALKQTWLASPARVVTYMDVDLSTDLAAFQPLVAPLLAGQADVAIGSRLSPDSDVVRGLKREFISRSYNLILKGSLGVTFSDAQCGFKGMRTDIGRELLPLVEDNNWFFDTELLVLAERSGLRIHEVAVRWVDDPDSRVDIAATAMEDLRGIRRIGKSMSSARVPVLALHRKFVDEYGVPDGPVARGGMFGQLWRFGLIGVGSTLAHAGLFVLFRLAVGPQWSNLFALLITAVANTALNRRLTFRVQGGDNLGRHHLGGLAVFAAGLAITSGSLWILHALAPNPPRGVEVLVLVLANAVATVLRFAALRKMMHKPS